MKHKTSPLSTLSYYKIPVAMLVLTVTLVVGAARAPVGPLGRKSRGARWTQTGLHVPLKTTLLNIDVLQQSGSGS